MSYDFPQNCPIPDACATVYNERYLQTFFSAETYVQRLKIKYLNEVKKSLRNGFAGIKTLAPSTKVIKDCGYFFPGFPGL